MFRAFNWVPREIDYHLRTITTEEIPSLFKFTNIDSKRIELSSKSFSLEKRSRNCSRLDSRNAEDVTYLGDIRASTPRHCGKASIY